MTITLRMLCSIAVSFTLLELRSEAVAMQPQCHQGTFVRGRNAFICLTDGVLGPSRFSRPGDFSPDVLEIGSDVTRSRACTASAPNGDAVAKTLALKREVTVEAREENVALKLIGLVRPDIEECCHGFSASSNVHVRGRCSVSFSGLEPGDTRVARVMPSFGSIALGWSDCDGVVTTVTKRVAVELTVTCRKPATGGPTVCRIDGKLQRFLIQDGRVDVSETKEYTRPEGGAPLEVALLEQPFTGTSHMQEDGRFLDGVVLASRAKTETRCSGVLASATVSARFDPFNLTDKDENIKP